MGALHCYTHVITETQKKYTNTFKTTRNKEYLILPRRAWLLKRNVRQINRDDLTPSKFCVKRTAPQVCGNLAQNGQRPSHTHHLTPHTPLAVTDTFQC